MTTDQGSYTPLRDLKAEPVDSAPRLDRAVELARKVFEEKAAENIHDRDAMIRAAYGLHHVLGNLLAAYDEEKKRCATG